MFQTAWCLDLNEDTLQQNILVSETLEKEIAELNKEYARSVSNAACERVWVPTHKPILSYPPVKNSSAYLLNRIVY